MYELWGGKDKIKRFFVQEEEKRTGWEIILFSHGIPLMVLDDGSIGKLPRFHTALSIVGQSILVAGGLDEAAFIEFLRVFPFDPEDSLPGLGNFYHDRLKRTAHLGLFGVRRPRLSDEDITLIVEGYNRIPSYMTSKS